MKLMLIFCCFLLVNCSKAETASNESGQTNSNKIVSVAPTIEPETTLKPVTSKIKLSSKQKKYLNESLPPQVREILEKAETFEVLAEVWENIEDDKDSRTFEPNRSLKVIDEKDKQEILEAFYFDASRGDSPAICFYPRHLISAIYEGKTVKIDICFSCSRFFVTSSFGEFEGTIVRENRKSEDFFDQMIKNKSVEIK